MLFRQAFCVGLVASAALPEAFTTTAAGQSDLVKRQNGATYAGTCTFYTGALLGGALSSTCVDANVPGPYASQTCGVLGLQPILQLGNCQPIQTASTCTQTVTASRTSSFVPTFLVFGTYSYYNVDVTSSICTAMSFATRPAVVKATPTPTTTSMVVPRTSTTATPSPTQTITARTTSSSSTLTTTSTSTAAATTSSSIQAVTTSSTSTQQLTTSSITVSTESIVIAPTRSSSSSISSSKTSTTSTSSASMLTPAFSSSSVQSSTTTSAPGLPMTSAMASTSGRASSTNSPSTGSSSLSVGASLSSTRAPSSSSNPSSISSARASPTAGLPRLTKNGGQYLGCFLDDQNQRTLPTRLQDVGSVEACVAQCQAAGYSLAGVEYYTQCFCGYAGTNGQPQIDESNCSFACSNDATETCGGGNALQLYQVPAASTTSSKTPTATAGLPKVSKNGGQYMGCYKDDTNQRALPVRLADVGTVEACIAACQSAGYSLAGLEYYYQCFCGNAGFNGQPQVDDSACNTPCNDDKTETCGGGNALQVYSIAAATASPSPSPSPTAGLPRVARNGGNYLGCYKDDVNQRTLPVRLQDVGTVEACITACQSAGYAVAGLEYTYQCFCGASGTTNGQPQIDDSTCNMPCNDDNTETCGGGNAIQLYTVPVGGGQPTIPKAVSTTSGKGTFQGCYRDDVNWRTLPNRVSDVGSVDQCVNLCISAGYNFAGVEYTRECYCGNALTAATVDNAQCQKYTCLENGSQKCGGDSAIQVYAVQASSQDGNAVASGTWSNIGCLQDFYPNTRTLEGYSFTSNSMTPQLCMSTCKAKGFTYAGVEYAGECYCDNQIRHNPQTLSSCMMACSGDSTQLCGGSNAIQVFTLGSVASGTGSSTSAATSASTSMSPGKPSIQQLTSNGATYKGCFTDTISARALRNRLADVTDADPLATCAKACKSAGYALAGVEYGHECFCDNGINNGQVQTADGACNQVCDGNNQLYCGNGNIVQVYALN